MRAEDLHCSPRILSCHPGIVDLLLSVHRAARELDEDIPVDGIRVDVRAARWPGSWAGTAYRQTSSLDRRYRRRVHGGGRITMRVGDDVADRSIVRIFAHELRHLGQFQRGAQQTGRLQIVGMTARVYERDCRTFEGRVLDHMGLGSDDEYAHRNDGRQTPPGA